jgi:hypothetical protein
MEPHTNAGEFSVSDVHRAIDRLTVLRIRLQHLARQHASGGEIDPGVFRELGELASDLAPTLFHCRDHHRDAPSPRLQHLAPLTLPPSIHAQSPRSTTCLHAAT